MRVAAIALAAVVLGLVVPSAASAADPPRCHGAASRDPERPCRNPALKLKVFPKPEDALLAPYSPCPTLSLKPLFICGFRDRPEAPSATVALLGDSHASHWRAALERVAELGWRGVSIARTGCPLTEARRRLPSAMSRGCADWNDEVQRHLRAHPEIETVFVSQNAGAKVRAPRGTSQERALISGYQRAWRRLPASVKHVVVIRDTPRNTSGSGDCVTRAARANRPAGTACAVPRGYAVQRDPAVVAARQMRSARVQVIDMTRFFCSLRLCPPVIGGVLVHKDVDHITTQYSTSLGPYLLRHIRRLRLGWDR